MSDPTIAFCPRGPDGFCESNTPVGSGTHYCGKRAGHDAAHACLCYWRWPNLKESA